MTDNDHDGLDDELEEEMLRRYRPYYKFSLVPASGVRPERRERYWPCDALEQVKRAQLMESDWDAGGDAPRIVKIGPAPHHLLDPAKLLTCVDGRTDLTKTPQKTRYHLNVEDDARFGPGPDEARAQAPGLYGHVVPLGGDDEGLIKIEYWQYFAYSGVDISGGDHEGDWCTVQLWFDPHAHKLVRTGHYAHGREMLFHLRYPPNPVAVPGEPGMVEYRGPNYSLNPGSLRYDHAAFQDNTVRFVKDGDDEHVVVYIERDSHEFWPTDRGSYPFTNEHNGRGLSYLTAYEHPLNLGEVEAPLSSEARVVLGYNGYWGCWHHPWNEPPPGPALHREWAWPASSALKPRIPDVDFER